MPRRPTGRTLALATALPVGAAATLALPAALAGAVDAALDHAADGRSGAWSTALVRLALVLGTAAAADALAAAAGPACAAEATAALRGRLVAHLLTLGPGGRPTRGGPPPGDLAARLTGSAADAGGRLPALLGAGTALLGSVGAIVGLGVLSPWLALAFFAGVLPGAVLIRLFLRDAGPVFLRYQEAQAALAARLTAALTGLRTIHAAGTTHQEATRLLGPTPTPPEPPAPGTPSAAVTPRANSTAAHSATSTPTGDALTDTAPGAPATSTWGTLPASFTPRADSTAVHSAPSTPTGGALTDTASGAPATSTWGTLPSSTAVRPDPAGRPATSTTTGPRADGAPERVDASKAAPSTPSIPSSTAPGGLEALSAAGHALWAAQRRTAWQAMLLVAVVEVAVLATAGALVADGRLAPGGLAAAAGWAALGAGLFEQVEALVGVAHARAGQARVDEVLAFEPSPVGTTDLPVGGPGTLHFQNVVVRDGDGRTLLGPLDLTVPGGATVALVGRSGAGKSLLAALPGRLRDPDEGAVLLDGVPVTELTPAALRDAVGYAFARPVLVGRTVREALDGAGPAEATAAHADGFLRRLPLGWETPPEELRLSGGELQRLGLARLLAHPTRVVVLDDAMSGLDLATEYQVGEALDRATRGRTRLVVAHRETAAAHADLVAWLDAGRLRALAPHRDLLADPDYRTTLSGTTLEAATH
ncbi:ATP-binding cassette domain-containing protein [Kitasatospora sp. NPDC093806]|uniref:ATP-binding cassette domain-containing protein n=1 Tax=Kitasatospora sp. NPDC093806 TaxID=3155075 RepID=UPI00341AD834